MFPGLLAAVFKRKATNHIIMIEYIL